MTIAELPKLLTAIGFDFQQSPAVRDSIALAELEYDQIDRYWRFAFRWDDMRIGHPPEALPPDVWREIEPHASPGKEDVMIYIFSSQSKWSEDSDWREIEDGLRDEIRRLTMEAERIAKLLAPWVE